MAVIGSSTRIVPGDVFARTGGDYLRGDQYLRPELREAATRDADVSRLRRLHEELRERHAAIGKALATDDPSRTPEAHYIEVARQAEKWFNDYANRSSDVTASAKDMIAAIDNDIAARLEIREGRYSAEIRDHFKRLKKEDRLKAAHKAVAKGDKETLAALLVAPAYLSNLDEKEQTEIREVFTLKLAADLVERRRVIALAVEVNFNAFNEMMDAMSVLFPKEKVGGIAQRIDKAQAVRNDIWQPA